MRVYLDNAATTALDDDVIQAMLPYFKEFYGNPSSLYAEGRKAKAAIEESRKKVADLLNVSVGEIFFTAGGTEADNMAILGAVEAFSYKNIITSPLEHHAVLHTVDYLKELGYAVHYLRVDGKGDVDLNHLEELLEKNGKSLVALMHANNEIGNLTDIEKAGKLTHQYGGFFHTDAVQSVGHFPLDLSKNVISSLAASSHKFHGPKGTGILYVNKKNKIKPRIHGGSQERNMRAGTENVAGIVGFTKALEIAFSEQEAHEKHIQEIKNYMIKQLKELSSEITFNGNSATKNSLSTLVSVNFPIDSDASMFLFQLDLKGVSASGGSACSSGALSGSHVLNAIERDSNGVGLRFSFSRFTTKEDIDYAIKQISSLMHR